VITENICNEKVDCPVAGCPCFFRITETDAFSHHLQTHHPEEVKEVLELAGMSDSAQQANRLRDGFAQA